MRGRLAGAGPVAPVLATLAVSVWLVTDDGGFALGRWSPVAIAGVVLLAVRCAVSPPSLRAAGRPVLVATAALGAYAAWSALSISWADDKGIAWEGTNRTVLYLVVFAFVALWPVPVRQARAAVVLWTFAIVVLALVTLLHAAGAARPSVLFAPDRLLGPGGYANASAAIVLMALWPAGRLAADRDTPWPLRALLAGGAVLVCDVALLSQSRGSLVAVPLCAAVLLVLGPDRVRLAAVLAAIGGGLALSAPAVLDVGTALRAGKAAHGPLHTAVQATILSAVLVAVVVGAVALVDGRRLLGPRREALLHRACAGVAVAVLVAGIVVGALAVGGPASAASRAWDSFKGGYATSADATRLTSGLGSNRYDFYRVGLDVFRAHPLGGIGADNFKAAYLREGRSNETPTYPHSIEIRTLEATGVIGALLLGAFLAAWAVALVVRVRAGGEAARVAAAAAGVTVYWLVHGSADWFWEFAGLGTMAFAQAGLAVAPARAALAPRRGGATAAFAILPGLLLTVALALPWLAQRQVDRAGRSFASDPGGAIALLRSASRLDRLDRRPLEIEGSAWLRVGDRARARRAFAAALRRDPRAAYSELQLGAIASAEGSDPRARTLLQRAVADAPRDPTARAALAVVRSGRRIDLARLQARILADADRFASGPDTP